MKREIRTVDEARGLVQWTMPDERWYGRRVNGSEVENDFVPSVTWICSYYHKGEELARWIAKHGWDESQQIKAAAGDQGDKVHQGCAILLAGGTVTSSDCFTNPRTLEPEPITAHEYLCLMSLCEWYAEYRPEVIVQNCTVWNERYRYAGTLDLYCRIDGKPWIIDFKTSSDIFPSHEIQVSAYKHADPSFPKGTRLGILQLGYKRNKIKKWKFKIIRDQFQLFLATRRIWEKETEGQQILQRDYPLSLSLGNLGLDRASTVVANGDGSVGPVETISTPTE